MRIQTMHKLLIGVCTLAGLLVVAAPVSRVTNFVDGQVLPASQLNSEFNNVIGGVNSINNAQIATNAAISPTKISATIKGDGISRDGTTGALSAKTDNTTLEIVGDNMQIKDNGVSLAKMADNSVGTTELVDSSVTTVKIADGSVTQAKRVALGQQLSASSSVFTNSTNTYTDVTNLTVTITTTGRPVFIGMIAVPGSANPGVRTESNGGIITGKLQFLQASSSISETTLNAVFGASGDPASSIRYPCSAFTTITVPSAGTYTYKVQAAGGVNFNTTTLTVQNCQLVAYEL